MKHKILFLERKPSEFVSIERVFRQIAKHLPEGLFDFDFQQMLYQNNLFGILKNLVLFRKQPADIYHITGHIHYLALLLPKRTTVLTIHDLVILHTRSGLRRYVLKKLLFDLPLKRLEYVTVVSEATKIDLLTHTNVDPLKICVIENPLCDGYVSAPEKQFNRECPTILQIGTMDNKNVPNLVHALNGLTCKLRIIGRLDDKIIKALKANETSYENICDLDEKEIVEQYRNADIVAFCSTSEGFGLPIIEAQAMSKAVITSDLSPMKDIAGGGAVLVDPYDISSIRNGILKLMNEPELRKELIKRGLRNVERFDPKKIARQYADLYEQVLANDALRRTTDRRLEVNNLN